MPPFGSRIEARFVRRALDISLDPVVVAAAFAGDRRPVVLAGDWAGGGAIFVSEPVRHAPSDADPFEILTELPHCETATGQEGVGGGWFGYLGYQLGRRLERLPPAPGHVPAASDFDLAYYDHLVRFDAKTRRWWFEALWTPERDATLEERFHRLRERLSGCCDITSPGQAGPFRAMPGPAAHAAAVRRCLEHIRAGDVYQVNLCLALETSWRGDAFAAFTQATGRLRPAYAAYLGLADRQVLSLSPELFLRRTGRQVVSRPIKGTCQRADDPQVALRQMQSLLGSDKDRAENVMIVDLMRNDLGRTCRPGTVRVPVLIQAEPHPGVWHLVSEVCGEMHAGSSDADLLRTCFPAGSITGAPKIRAMQLINELEVAPRIVYTGSVGYVSPVAGLEVNVAIRTFEISGDRIRLGVGGGIVADSDPVLEVAECRAKAAPLIAALGSVITPELC